MGVFLKEENRLVWIDEGERLVIEAWGENSLRVRAVPNGEIIEVHHALLTSIEKGEGAVWIEEKGLSATIINGNIKAKVEKNDWTKRCQISFYNEKDDLLLREIGSGGALDLYSRKFKPIRGGDYQLIAIFDSEPTEKLYGMGQYQQEIMNLKNCSFELAHRNSQASIPFVLSSLGYGFLWHNPAIGQVHFSKNQTQWGAISTKQLDYWITAGNEPKQIVEAYANVTGKVPMMPEYGLGFWQCKLRYYNQEQLLSVAREYKKRNLPIDVIVCDFFHWPRMGDFRFDETFFPDPKGMVEELKQMGIELMVSIWPQIDLRSENYEEMKEQGLLVQVESGVHICMEFGGYSSFFDATNPRARAYVWNKCKQNYYDYGIKLFWLDEAEPEYRHYDFEHYRYYEGSNLQIGNLYPQKFSKSFYDGMAREGQENIVNLVRCAWAGSQRYGALVWSGDIHSNFEDFRKQICAGLHMGIAGIPWWTTDIGGFGGGNPDDESFRELLIRWFQYGTFCPVMRLHGDRMPQTPIIGSDGQKAVHTGGDNEVWSFGEETYPILVKFLHFREMMRPYIRLLMEEAHKKGSPIMRTMFYEFPQDASCWELQDQYMFGSDVLVAPVTKIGARSREVYLPQGVCWQEIHTGKVYEGGRHIMAKAPIDVIPVFIKGGSKEEWIGKI
jgi:alpha-D-xyloside xylohydrolase